MRMRTDGGSNAQNIHLKIVNSRLVKIIDGVHNIPVSIFPGTKIRQVLIAGHPRPRRFGLQRCPVREGGVNAQRFEPQAIVPSSQYKITPEDTGGGAIKDIGIGRLQLKGVFDLLRRLVLVVLLEQINDPRTAFHGLATIVVAAKGRSGSTVGRGVGGIEKGVCLNIVIVVIVVALGLTFNCYRCRITAIRYRRHRCFDYIIRCCWLMILCENP
mmetsp:Transcript_7436/g.10827  ORF Transcript_7436/g.10827 Transcript_7436/m.10827 type:complete len:214 (-) Transcript_7436:210-851(-)